MSKSNEAHARKARPSSKTKKTRNAADVEQISHAALFRAIRERLGLTQDQAAKRLAYTQTNVSKVEKKTSANLGQISQLIGEDYDIVVVLRPKAHLALEEFRFALS